MPSTVARSAPNNNYHIAKAASTSTRAGDWKANGHNTEKAKADLILSLLTPGELLDCFWTRTEIVTRSMALILPKREHAEAAIRSVSPFRTKQ